MDRIRNQLHPTASQATIVAAAVDNGHCAESTITMWTMCAEGVPKKKKNEDKALGTSTNAVERADPKRRATTAACVPRGR